MTEIVIEDVAVSPAGAFSVVVDRLPLVLPPGGALSFNVVGAPAELGRVEGALSLHPANNDAVVVPLAIEGIRALKVNGKLLQMPAV